MLAVAAEGEPYMKEMSVWSDIRAVKEFAAVTVPEEIDYPRTRFVRFRDVFAEALGGGKRLGICGLWDISSRLLDRIRSAAEAEIVDADQILIEMRLIKSPAEIACLAEAGRIACQGYEKLLAACVPGASERQVAGIAEGACRSAGAEAVNFHVMGSGPRTNLVIPRAAQRIIADGDMVISSLAIQYEGYVATVEFPFVAGKANDAQRQLLDTLFEAANVQLRHLRAGAITGQMVREVRDVFRRKKLDQFDLYPPMHGCGLAEAESPYPNEDSTYEFRTGMCVNSDISLFGTPVGSNRLEEGFTISDAGPQSLTPLIRELSAKRGN
jgi:Xaa-Pro aminopeptidase